jgi:hypothetical protein
MLQIVYKMGKAKDLSARLHIALSSWDTRIRKTIPELHILNVTTEEKYFTETLVSVHKTTRLHDSDHYFPK